jgi:hypothetical protein
VQNTAGHATLFTQETNQNMLAADVAVVESFSFFLG